MVTSDENWLRPPVVEVALAVQFVPLERLTAGHFGRFWGELGESTYPLMRQGPPIQTIAEGFGEEMQYTLPGISFAAGRIEPRIQFVSKDESRMVQLQNGWVVVNWIKQSETDYPGFKKLYVEFQRVLKAFAAFIQTNQLGDLKANLWEITYIDHIAKGTVWNDHTDAPKVVPGLLGPAEFQGSKFEAINSRWAFYLKPLGGRLSIGLMTARSSQDDSATDLLVLTTTARGPITSPELDTMLERLKSGRTVVVDAFKRATSDEAKAYWKG